MAQAVLAGAKEAGAEASLFTSAQFQAPMMDEFDAIAFGCPAMGAEVLEEDEFEPFFTGVEGKLSGKKVALFGSYGWGDGQWMRDWYDRTAAAGAVLQGGEGLICNEMPDDDALAACRDLGRALAG